MVREALAGFHEEFVQKAQTLDLTEPAKAYVHLQHMVGLHGQPSPDGLKTLAIKQPVGDIVAVALDKNAGMYDLVAINKDGSKRKLDANSFLEPDKVAELKALCNELKYEDS